MAGFTMWVDADGLQIGDDRSDAGLRGIGAIAVGSAAVDRGNRSRPPAVAIFGVPVVGAGCGIWVFDFIDHARVFGYPSRLLPVVRWYGGKALTIAEPERIGMTEHDVIGPGASEEGLVEVVADGVLIGESSEVGSVAGLHVVKGERGRSFAGGLSIRNVGQVVVGEAGRLVAIVRAERRLRGAVRARADRDFHIGKQLAVATGRILWGAWDRLQFNCCCI